MSILSIWHDIIAFFFSAESIQNRRGPRCRFVSQLASNFSSFEKGDFDTKFGAVLGIDADAAFKYGAGNGDADGDDKDDNDNDDEVNNDDDDDDEGDDDGDDDDDDDAKNYFLMTKSTAPFCGRHVKVDLHISRRGRKR